MLRSVLFFALILGFSGAPAWADGGEAPQQEPFAGAEEVQGELAMSEYRENWILSELKSLRRDMMDYRNAMTKTVTDRELEVADKAMSYATDTVTYFFYLIAGAVSMLALVGWSTMRDLKDNVRVYAEKEMGRLTKEYEDRLAELENEVRKKSLTIAENQEEIERTNEVHSLWLKSTKEVSVQARIEVYDSILALRPDDPEALAWKADAALELGEKRWALSLCNRVLESDHRNAHALYQRACAWAGLGELEASLGDLAAAIDESDMLREAAREDAMLRPLHKIPSFESLVYAEMA